MSLYLKRYNIFFIAFLFALFFETGCGSHSNRAYFSPNSGVQQISSEDFYALSPNLHYQVAKLNVERSFSQEHFWGFCSGVMIAPSVVLTSGHCTRSHKYWETTPGAATEFRIGRNFENVIKIASTREGDGWYEFKETDVGLYRLKDPMNSGYYPGKFFDLPSPCNASDDIPGLKVKILGRQLDLPQEDLTEFQVSDPYSVSRVGTSGHSDGIYLVTTASTKERDNGGPWIIGNRIVAVTSENGKGARICDIVSKIQDIVKKWTKY
ncbi:MAG: trypsin-like serine protease [Oligoflexales bacterium]|nr:trypsin-like serine protease [Oligoflexales bacterium]